MKKVFLLFTISLFFSCAYKNSKQEAVNFFDPAPVSTVKKLTEAAFPVTKYRLLKVNSNLKSSLETSPLTLRMTLPIVNERGDTSLILSLHRDTILAEGFRIQTSDTSNPELEDVQTYRGFIEGIDSSPVAITIFNGELMGVASTKKQGNFVLGKMADGSGNYIVYNDKDLTASIPFTCDAKLVPGLRRTLSKVISPAEVTAKCINWYWETDYDIFLDKGSSAANVNAYMQGIFNNVATLYANEGFTIKLKELYIWTTVDPYTGPTTSDYLTQFGNYRTNINGANLAHLFGYKGGGGIAWVGGLCSITQYEQGYSGISSSYSTVPTYSWTIEVTAHEEGHLFGSGHTHGCNFTVNGIPNVKVDDCGTHAGYNEGTCGADIPDPTGGGTIMSYCHLRSIGINLSKGFSAPVVTVMMNSVNASACLSSCATCIPIDTKDTLTCQAGYTGSIIRHKVYSCPIGTWKIDTISNTCIPDTCTTYVQKQTLPCPTGQTGIITQSRTHICPQGTFTPWVTIYNSCADTCTSRIKYHSSHACPAGQTGNIDTAIIVRCPGHKSDTVVSNTCAICANPFDVKGKITVSKRLTYWIVRADGEFMNNRTYLWESTTTFGGGLKSQIIYVPATKPGTYTVTMKAPGKSCLKNNVVTITLP